MASYRGHLMFSSALGAAYGGVAAWQLQLGWAPVFLGAGLTTIGGLLPDLDSQSGVPVRELFSLAASIVPLFILRRLWRLNIPGDEILVIMALVYVLIRYGLSHIFKRLTVHRGMFHSLPAMLIAGMVIFLIDKGSTLPVRLFLSGGVMIGFLSHLILDELCSVDFMGITIRLNKYAGSAVKLYSSSWPATLTCYVLLCVLAFFTWRDLADDLGLRELASGQ
jgi:hypothetical protein